MKIVIAFLAGIAVAQALVTCPDKEFQCPDGDTCCQLKDGGFGCCPMPSAVCCKDGTHCCAHGTTCNLEKGTCDSVAVNLLMSVLRSQGSIMKSDSFPATPAENSEPDQPIQCPDGGYCMPESTCCQNKTGGYNCCMEGPTAVCCKDKERCCPHSYACTERGMCNLVPTNLFMSMLRKSPDLGFDTIQEIREIPATMLEESRTAPDAIAKITLKFGDGSERKIIDMVSFNEIEERQHRCNATTTCPEEKTCCNGRGRKDIWGCCPWENGVCCPNMESCCPEGTQCDDKRHKCFIPTPHYEFPAALAEEFDVGSNTPCAEEEFLCPDGNTCCAKGTKCNVENPGYCIIPTLVNSFPAALVEESEPRSSICTEEEFLCPDGNTCCAKGTKCDVQHPGYCFIPTPMDSLLEKASKKQQRLEPGLQRKMVPATNVPLNPIPFMNCNILQTRCNSGGTDFMGCCPFAGAMCCPDRRTCCPSGMECVNTTGPMCAAGNQSVTMDSLLEKASEKQQRLEPGLRRKMVPATNVPLNPYPFRDCDYPETLCHSQGTFLDQYGCCPFSGAVCCPDRRTCCPSGMECVTTTGPMCAGNRSVMVETFFRLIDSDLMIPRKWMSKQPRKVEGKERVSEYRLLGGNAEWWSLRNLYARDQV